MDVLGPLTLRPGDRRVRLAVDPGLVRASGSRDTVWREVRELVAQRLWDLGVLTSIDIATTAPPGTARRASAATAGRRPAPGDDDRSARGRTAS